MQSRKRRMIIEERNILFPPSSSSSSSSDITNSGTLRQSGSSYKLELGNYSYPFQFTIPSTAPPTVSYRSGKVCNITI